MPKWYTRPLVDGEVGRDVQVVQRKLGTISGVYDEATRALVRGYQQRLGLNVDGVVGPLTANALGESADHALTPDWFSRTLDAGCEGEDVAGLRASLALTTGTLFDEETRKAVLRFQSAHGLPLSGSCDLRTALTLP